MSGGRCRRHTIRIHLKKNDKKGITDIKMFSRFSFLKKMCGGVSG